ncbi:hypothetical protein CMO92_01195 [Candidatus Woesearchaeota archaeon]|nr:hypothetical protein [Candidatus Woesearchaeota archaeon]|tara:strand:+ start:877 stop:1341 length:465 start_codon:yes stop_codon:yes gene_type:complete
MKLQKKAQGATEYLIILAIVIIIALIVVGAMGGIPGIGTGARSRASSSFWQTADIAIPAYAVTASNDDMVLDVRNNLRNSISSLTVTVDSDSATCSQTSLSAGQVANCTITDVTSCAAGDAFSFAVSITYTDDETSAAYTYTGEGHNLDGKCAT